MIKTINERYWVYSYSWFGQFRSSDDGDLSGLRPYYFKGDPWHRNKGTTHGPPWSY